MTEVLVFVPGILGSELFDEKGRVWPGNLKDGIFKFSTARFKRLKADDLRVGDVMRRAAGVVDVYGSWISTFESLRSRETGSSIFAETGDRPTLVTVPYDWRKPIEQASEALALAIDKVVQHHGANATIHIAAHSMGGLVSRHFLQSGTFNDRLGFYQIATLMTFGTPHKGACMALAAATGHHAAQFLSASQTKELANDLRYPSLYQLLPHEGSATVWDSSPGGRLQTKDVFGDRAFARQLELNEGNLDATAAFHAILQKPMPDLRTFMFVGSRLETLTHFLYDGRSLTPVRTPDAGDGTVPLQGAVLEGQQIRFTDRGHLKLVDADESRHTLQMLFHADGLLADATGTEVVIDITDLVVPYAGHLEVSLTFKSLDRHVEGTLHLERARPSPEATEIAETDFDTAHPEHVSSVQYDGPSLASLRVQLEDLKGPAIYRPVFTAMNGSRRFIGPSFVVQHPQ